MESHLRIILILLLIFSIFFRKNPDRGAEDFPSSLLVPAVPMIVTCISNAEELFLLAASMCYIMAIYNEWISCADDFIPRVN
jgi:hypothetical protein